MLELYILIKSIHFLFASGDFKYEVTLERSNKAFSKKPISQVLLCLILGVSHHNFCKFAYVLSTKPTTPQPLYKTVVGVHSINRVS